MSEVPLQTPHLDLFLGSRNPEVPKPKHQTLICRWSASRWWSLAGGVFGQSSPTTVNEHRVNYRGALLVRNAHPPRTTIGP